MQSQRKSVMIFKLAILQAVATILFSVVLYYCYDARQALSGLFGGLIATITSFYMAGRLFMSKSDLPPEQLLARTYVSFVLKFVMTIAMMTACIVVLKVSFLPFIIAYAVAAMVINWLFLLVPDSADS